MKTKMEFSDKVAFTVAALLCWVCCVRYMDMVNQLFHGPYLWFPKSVITLSIMLISVVVVWPAVGALIDIGKIFIRSFKNPNK